MRKPGCTFSATSCKVDAGELIRVLHVQKMYVTMFPCNECSKLLIQAGIREIVYYEDKAAPVRDTSPNEAAQSNIRCVRLNYTAPPLQYYQYRDSPAFLKSAWMEVEVYLCHADSTRDQSHDDASQWNIQKSCGWACRTEDAYAASKRLLRMTGVKLRQHQLDRPLVFCLGT